MEKWKENWHEKILVAIICVSVGIFLIDYAFGRQGVMLFAKMLSFIIFLIPIAVIYWFIEHFKFGKLKNLTELDLLQAEVKKRHYLAEHTVHELSGGAVFHVNHLRGQGNYHSKTRSRVLDSDAYGDSDISGAIEAEQPEIREQLLDVIGQSQQIWMVGGMGAGKTSLLAHLSDMFESYGETQYIIDPNMEPDKWAASNRIKILVGGGNDYGEVYKAMIHIISLINKRLIALRNGQRGQGDFKKQIIRIVVDEWTLIPSSLKMLKDKAALMNFMQMMGMDGSSQGAAMDRISPDIVLNYFIDFLCTQGRKVGVYFCFATHSETTRSTGFDKRHDLFEQINHKVFIRLIGNDRYANVQFGSMSMDKEMKYELPGQHQRMVELENREYTTTQGYTTATPVYSDVAEASEMAFRKRGKGGFPGASGSGCVAIGMQEFNDLTEEDEAVIRNYRNTGSLNKTILNALKLKKNPKTLQKCKAILNKFGVI